MSRMYSIPVNFEMSGFVVVEANNLEEAKEIALNDSEKPTNTNFIEGSVRINDQMVDIYN